MPVTTSARMPVTTTPAGQNGELKQAHHISEPGGLTQFDGKGDVRETGRQR
jgi:hypothetical protein